MTKYYKVEINKNLIKKLFKLDIEKFKIDLKQNINYNFSGVQTNYVKVENELKQNNTLMSEDKEKIIDKSKLFFYITNGKWTSEADEVHILKIGDYLDTDVIEDGFSAYLQQLFNEKDDFFSFYTKDDHALIKKVLGSKSILEEVEIDDSKYSVNKIESFINWKEMHKQQSKIETTGAVSVTWGNKEIQNKRERVLRKFIDQRSDQSDMDYIVTLKTENPDAYNDFIYDVLIETKVGENKKEIIKLRRNDFFRNAMSRFFKIDHYNRYNYEHDVMCGIHKMNFVGLDLLNFRAKFLLKVLKSFDDDINNEDVNKEIMGYTRNSLILEIEDFARLSKVLPVLQEFTPFVGNSSDNLYIGIFNDIKKYIDTNQHFENTIVRNYLRVNSKLEKEEILPNGVNKEFRYSFENIVLEKYAELKKLKELSMDILKISGNLINIKSLMTGSHKEKMEDIYAWIKSEEIYKDIQDISKNTKILIAANYMLKKFTANDANYDLIRKIFKEIANNESLKQDVSDVVFYKKVTESDILSIDDVHQIKEINGLLHKEISDIDIFNKLQKVFSNRYVNLTLENYLEAEKSFVYKSLKNGLDIVVGESVSPDEKIRLDFKLKFDILKNKENILGEIFENKIDFDLQDMIKRSKNNFREYINDINQGANQETMKKTLFKSMLAAIQGYAEEKRKVAKDFYMNFLNTPENKEYDFYSFIWNNVFSKQNKSLITYYVTELEGNRYAFHRNNEWGQAASRKLLVTNKDLVDRFNMIEKLFDSKYDLLLSDEMRADFILKCLRIGTTNLVQKEEDFQTFKRFLAKVKITHKNILEQVFDSCIKTSVLSKKKQVEYFDKLEIKDDLELCILNKNNLIVTSNYIDPNKIKEFYSNNQNKEKLKEIKAKALGYGEPIQDEVLRKMMGLGFISREEYTEALEQYLSKHGGYDIFPKFKMDIYNRNLMKEYAEIIKKVVSITDRKYVNDNLNLIKKFFLGFSKDILEEDKTIELMASILQNMGEKYGSDFYTKNAASLKLLYQIFGDERYEVIKNILDDKEDSLENVLTKIKFVNLSADKVEVRRAKI